MSAKPSTNMRAVVVERLGGPEVLQVREWPKPTLQSGQVLIEVQAAGVNFVEIMSRRTGYLAPEPPFVPGMEVSGVVSALGDGVGNFAVGQRVCALTLIGGYAEFAVAQAELVAPIPDETTFPLAASLPTIVPTAYALVHHLGRVRAADRVLVTAAAGATGMVIGQLTARTGAHTIGVVSRPEKVAAAKAYGFSSVITTDELHAGALDADPVDLVLDSVGGTVRERCWAVLAPLGMLVAYGNASGESEDSMAPGELRARSQSLAGFSVSSLASGNPEVLARLTHEAIDAAVREQIVIDVALELPLERAPEAHRAVESRESTGKVVITLAAL